MQYLHVVWHHDFPSEPIAYYSEVGDDGWEVRRVQEYRDGRIEWADESHETDTVGLSEAAIDIAEIQSQAEFDLVFLEKGAFEEVWMRARA
jgi:hypothetical protein